MTPWLPAHEQPSAPTKLAKRPAAIHDGRVADRRRATSHTKSPATTPPPPHAGMHTE
ncbi:MAG: hypothetical protein IPQ09_28625 [Myxococcales bacterium]|nr:hypothetical protein [Myxococcales bacterium]